MNFLSRLEHLVLCIFRSAIFSTYCGFSDKTSPSLKIGYLYDNFHYSRELIIRDPIRV
ncbi:MAG: hypothetical protein RBG13Loki_0261 [Promethearchaeota archaeon CR_4]|nr:MAG: hypothetical protein RBG13Loki_0261 [Candidatus Lokiarchaeota archaeon CR_4]